jgi:tripeptide aminopeptidase
VCRAKPKRQGDRIVSDGTTAAGRRQRHRLRVLVALAETLIKHKLPHPPITLLFTVRERAGCTRPRDGPQGPGRRDVCFNADSTHAAILTIGAVGQENWQVEIKGKAAHAGVAPERGSPRFWWRPSL